MSEPSEELMIFRQKLEILARCDVTLQQARLSCSLQQWATNFLQRISFGLYRFSYLIVPESGRRMSPTVKKQHRHLPTYFPSEQIRESIAGAFPEVDRSEHWHLTKLPVAGLTPARNYSFRNFLTIIKTSLCILI